MALITALDCNDNEPNEAPGLTEICGDGYDNDCNGGDETCPVNVTDNGGVSGRFGPSQSACDTTYRYGFRGLGHGRWQWLSKPAVPQTGLYAIKAYGASGGDTSGQGYSYSGNGAYVYGEFNLTQGQTALLVGHDWYGDWGDGGGGGGGTTLSAADLRWWLPQAGVEPRVFIRKWKRD